MCYNNCEICQFNEDFATAKALLQKALIQSVYTLMVKTEEAETAKALAEKEGSTLQKLAEKGQVLHTE